MHTIYPTAESWILIGLILFHFIVSIVTAVTGTCTADASLMMHRVKKTKQNNMFW